MGGQGALGFSHFFFFVLVLGCGASGLNEARMWAVGVGLLHFFF